MRKLPHCNCENRPYAYLLDAYVRGLRLVVSISRGILACIGVDRVAQAPNQAHGHEHAEANQGKDARLLLDEGQVITGNRRPVTAFCDGEGGSTARS